jgi:exopolysaccharide production protein ExoZ
MAVQARTGAVQLPSELNSGSASGRILPMEGMRGFAALLVFFVHFDALFREQLPEGAVRTAADVAGRFGHSGVDVFFAISGFLIYGIVFRSKCGYGTYLRRRGRRLYPTFLCVFVLYVAISLAMPRYSSLPSSSGERLWYLTQNLLMLPGMFSLQPMITVAWSLSYEWFSYLSIPLLIEALRMRRWTSGQRILTFVFVAATLLGASIAGYPVRVRLIMFCIGIIVWEGVTFGKWISHLKRWGEPIALLAFAANLLAIGLLGSGGPTSILMERVSRFYAASLFITVFLLLLYGMCFDGPLSRFFSWKWLRWFGNISYSYYLIHGLTLHATRLAFDWLGVEKPVAPWLSILLVVGCFAATVFTATLLYETIEKPLSFQEPERGGLPAPTRAGNAVTATQ